MTYLVAALVAALIFVSGYGFGVVRGLRMNGFKLE